MSLISNTWHLQHCSRQHCGFPYIVARVMTNGPLRPANYVDPTPRVRP